MIIIFSLRKVNNLQISVLNVKDDLKDANQELEKIAAINNQKRVSQTPDDKDLKSIFNWHSPRKNKYYIELILFRVIVKDGTVANFKIDLSNENDTAIHSHKVDYSKIETFSFK